jgi:uncharacterized pyridoxal phosphate-containing UPF0001 family protein
MPNAVDQLFAVQSEIHKAEVEANRSQGSVTLVTVSKTFDADAIRPVI